MKLKKGEDVYIWSDGSWHPTPEPVVAKHWALDRRKANGYIKIYPARYPDEDGEVTLEVSHNGWQSTCIDLILDEQRALIRLLTENLKAVEKLRKLEVDRAE